MLPQFTLNARIIFFMMVMFATATTASQKKTNDVVIMLKNHERALHVNAGGKVTATDISLAQFFSMEGVGDIFSDTFKIALYAREVGRYLCFRRGKLVGMKNLTRDCHFIESLDHGYFLYANAYNPLWRVGFTKGLKPVGPRHWKRPQTLKRACFLFVKINAEHFDRSRFTTTTTIAPNTKPIATAVTLREGQKLHESKASIIDSNSNNYKRTKSANSNGQRQLQINTESVNATGGRGGGRSRHRKRKLHAKLAGASSNNGSSSLLQPKNLVRHHHGQGNGEGRRRQHQREERERKLRLKNQRRQQQEHQDATSESEPMPNATNSATPSVAATTVAATASLAPSALNIVAMLAAGRRKRGRRKKPTDSSVTNLSSNSGHHQAMDLQLVAQSPLQAQSQYDRVQCDTTVSHKLRPRHEHNYLQQQQQQHTIAPVSSTSPSTKEVNKVQQQNHKYSNINTDSQLYKTSSSSRRPNRHNSSNSSSNSISHKNSHNLSHISNLNLKHNIYKDNSNNNNNNNNNNDTINAIPALPKNYLSKNNLNNEYLMQQTTRSSTDFNTKEKFIHSSHSSQIHRSGHSHSSHDFNKLLSTPVQMLVTSDGDYDNDNYSDSNTYMHEKNSNRLLVNNRNNVRDNNLQQEHLLNRFKLIYLDRIRSHSVNLKTNNKIDMQHYNNYNEHVLKNSPIRSTTTTKAAAATATSNETTTSKESHWVLEKSQRSAAPTNTEFGAYNNRKFVGRTDISRSIKKSRMSRRKLKAFTTSDYNRSHRRTKRNLINNYITNNNSNYYNDKKIYNSNANKDYIIENNNKKYAKISSSAGRRISSISAGNSNSSSSSSSKSNSRSFGINDRNINKQEYLNFLVASTAAYRKSKLFLGRKQQQKQQILKIIYNPNKYNYYNDNDYEKDDGGKFKQIQNKYEKIIVQYRSVFN